MIKKLLLLFFTVFSLQFSFAQCFEVLDGTGVNSDNPYFIHCLPSDFTIFIQPDQNIGPYVINWGDGSVDSTGALLTTAQNVSHTYTATTDTFIVTITDNGANNCSITGVVVMEQTPAASIQIPAGDNTFGCTPVQFRFINSSTQISETTIFEWDFGDGSPVETYDHTNLGDTVYHNYLPGVGVQSCNIEVTLTATNYCDASIATFSPLRVWDLDEAQITPSAALLCYPDTVVQYTNNTIRNCFPQGNQSQRYERWNFGDYWGLGRDSIIDWRPWNPPITPPPPIAYPGVGIYTVTLQDSSFCGIDDVMISIEITNPPTSIISSNKDTICEGENVTFFNNSIGGANSYEWNFDQGSGYQVRNGNNKTRTYNISGDYSIELVVGIAGAQGCRDTSSVDLHVLPSPSADFTFDNNNECDSMMVTFTDASTGVISSYNWDFKNGNTFSGANPPIQNFTSPGTYNVELTVANPRGCANTETQNIRVRETPVAAFTVSSVCLNQLASFVDQSTSGGDPIVSYKWYFGDGDSSSAQDPNHLYTAFGNYTVTQIVDNGSCSDTTTLMVTVENEPTAAFTVDNSDGCSRLTVNFTNASSANATTFRWNFGDGSPIVTARDTSHTFSNTGISDTTFIVSLIANTTFGCADTVYDTITVFPVPTPSFTSDAAVDCGPVTVNFNNTTLGDSLNFFWDFGDGTAVVNDTNPTHVFQNQTLFINNYEVQLIVMSNTGCTDTTSQIVTIYPEPVFTFSVEPDSGCSPLSVRFPSVVGAVNYNWDFGDGNTSSGPTPTHIFVNNTTNNQSFTVRLIAQNSFGCLDTTFGSVVVYPNPTSAFSLDTNVGCQPLPILLTNTSTGATIFEWDFGDGSTSDTADASFVKTYTNSSSLSLFNTIQLITETSDGCRDTSSRTVEVHPFIVAAFLSDTVGCSPITIDFNNQSVGASAYIWNFGDGGSSSAVNPSHLFNNGGNSNQTFLSKLIASSPEGCLDSTEKNILIYPKPTAQYTVSDSVGCQPLDVTFTNSSSLADSCSWKFGDGGVFNLCTPTTSHQYSNTTSFFPIDFPSELIVITDDGCSDTANKNIRVNPQIIASFTSDTAGCSPFFVQFQNQSQGGLNYEWSFGDGGSSTIPNGSNLFVNPSLQDSTYTVKLISTSQYGCKDSLEKGIEVFAKPIANYTLDTDSGCHPLTVNFTNTSEISDSCRWNFGDGSAINDSCFIGLSRTYTNTQSLTPLHRTAQLFVFTDNGCRDTTQQEITINPQIIADFDTVVAACSPLRVSFQNRSTGADTYQWTFGDNANSIATSPVHTYINPGQTDVNYNLQLTVNSQYGCSDNKSQNILVFAKPIADFSIDVDSGCHPLPVNFTDVSSSAVDSCRWNFGDGSAILDSCFVNRLHTYSNTQSTSPLHQTAQLFVFTDNGCRDTTQQEIIINPQIIADFDTILAGCSPLKVDFQNRSTGADDYQWTFGDNANSIATSPVHTYINPGQTDVNYNLQLTVNSQYGCSDNKSQNILVFAKPIADFSVDVDSGCHPLPVNFTDVSSSAVDSCRWNFGDGSAILDSCFTNRLNTYTNTQSLTPLHRTAQLLVFTDNGCLDTANKVIITNPQIIADYDTILPACSPLRVDFRDRSTGVDDYQWTFGDNGNSINSSPRHTYINPGQTDVDYNLQLTVSSQYGCSDSKGQTITVYAKPIAKFTVDVDSGCNPLNVLFSDSSSTAVDSCRWIFGDGTAVLDSCFDNRLKTYTNTQSTIPINRNAQLFVYTDNGCLDTANQNIKINPDINADFDSVPSGCHPLPISFRNQSRGVKNYEWFYGDGAGSPLQNPAYTYVNFGTNDTTFRIKLRTTSNEGCLDSLEQDIQIFPKPTADFTVDVDSGCQPLEVEFTNNSSIRDSCIWTYGDGNLLTDCSNLTNHTYTNQLSLVPLNYNAQLRIISNRGCTDLLNRNITVNPEIIADFTGPDTSCSPLNATFRSQSFGAIEYDWDFGDGKIGSGMITTNQFTNTSAADISFPVELIARSLYDCNDTLVKNVLVRSTPVPDFDRTPLSQIFPDATIDITNTTNTGNWTYFWDFDDSTSSTDRDPVSHTYSTWGQYNIKLIVSTPYCSDSVVKLVDIEVPFPVADFGDSVSGCQPLEVTFTNKTIYGQTYDWDFGDGGRSNAENPTHIYFNEGVYPVTLKVQGFEAGKQDAITKVDYIQVFKTPNADFITNKDKVFVPNDPLVFSNRSFNADSFFWDFGDGSTSKEQSPTYFYTEPGEYEVFMIASTNDGCSDTAYAPNNVIAELEGRIRVPNAFTPSTRGSNGGAVNINPALGEFNDVFYAKVSGTTKYELNIFNKWGELLFVSKDINIGWDGYYRGELAKQDVYVWKVKAEFADGTTTVKVGDLMLLR